MCKVIRFRSVRPAANYTFQMFVQSPNTATDLAIGYCLLPNSVELLGASLPEIRTSFMTCQEWTPDGLFPRALQHGTVDSSRPLPTLSLPLFT